MPSSHAVALIVLSTVASTPCGVKVSKAPTPPTGWNLRPQPPVGAAAAPGHWSGAPLGKHWGASQPEQLTGSAHPAWTGKVHHGQQSSSPAPLQHVEVGQLKITPSEPYKEYYSQDNSSRGFTVHYEHANATPSSWYNSTGWRLNHTLCRDHHNSTFCKFARWRTNHTWCHGSYNGSRCNYTYHSRYNHTYRNHYNHTYHNKTYHYNASRNYSTSPVATESKMQDERSVAPPWKQYEAEQNTKPTLKVHYDRQSSPSEGGQGPGPISPSVFRTGAHFQNLVGGKFDVNQPGEYLLLRVPKDGNETALLEVWGHFLASANAPCELYTRTLTITGKWLAEKKLHVHSMPFSMKVSQVDPLYRGRWRNVRDYFAVMSNLHQREILPQNTITISPIKVGEDVTAIDVHIGLKQTNNSTANVLRQEHASINIAPRAQGLDVVFSSVLSFFNGTDQFGGVLGNDREPSAEMRKAMCEAFLSNASDADLQVLYEERVGSRLSAA